MLKIICLNADNYLGRGREYVINLYDMVRRNLSDRVEGQFICFTNDPEDYPEGILKQPLPNPGLTGWWHKISLFKEGLFDEKDRIIYFDLDTCIVGGLDQIITYQGKFATLRDVYRPAGLQTSVMMWEAGSTHDIWNEWNAFRPILQGGDQAFIEKKRPNADIIQDLFPRQFRSYKVECQFDIPKHTSVVFFHGEPRPHQCGGWVEHIWKVGGGSTMEMELKGNTSDQEVTANVENALSLPYENISDQYMQPNGQRLVIVGGGPSLKLDVDFIRDQKKQGFLIWALNNTYNYLLERGITPEAHVMLDARDINLEFVPERNTTFLYAYQCHPQVIRKAADYGKVMLWCPLLPGMLDMLDKHKRKAALIGAGSSVGIKAIALAQVMGFREIHLYGYDSCYEGSENHAYKQPINDNERIIDVVVNGQQFRCAPWMARQAQEFRECMSSFVNSGMEIHVHGRGLIPYIASLMVKND